MTAGLLSALLSVPIGWTVPLHAQQTTTDAKQETKDAGKDLKKAGKHVAKSAKHAGKATKKAAKHAVKATTGHHTARCQDGTYSTSGNRATACGGHGGVRTWYGN